MKNNSILKKLTGSREAILAIVLIVLCLLVQLKSPTFLTLTSIGDLLKNNAVILILAVGMLNVLLIGGIDISITSTCALTGMTVGLLLKYNIITNTFLLFVIALAIGLACGTIIGLIISKGEVLPIIATMGFMYIYRGLAYVISSNQWASAADLGEFKNFALEKNLGFGIMNNVLVIVLVIYVAFFIIMKWTTFGRKIYAVGSNPEAAAVSGINASRVKLIVYAMMGTLAGLGGALATAVYSSAQPNMMYGQEMDVIAACVIGGVSMNGGRGSVAGVLFGALTMAVINKALPLVGIDALAQNTVQGLIILIVIIMNVLMQRTAEMNNLKRREM